MKVLLDECTPHVLKRLLTGIDITTVQEMGWSGITNGTLLRRAEGWREDRDLELLPLAL